MQDLTKLESGVVYNSGMCIADESHIATLCVFYDTVHLPSLSIAENREKANESLANELSAVKKWNLKYRELFHEGVFRRLSPPPSEVSREAFKAALIAVSFDEEMARRLDQNSLEFDELSYRVTLALHLIRTDILLPRIFSPASKLNRDSLLAVEACAAFSYLLPKLDSLRPDDILELRRKVKDTREGFTMHLQKLSKGLDGMVKAGEKLEDLKGYAQNIVETDLIPDYREFRRQLQAEQAGKTKKILDLTGKIAEIDAAPWTPKFWGLLLKSLGMAAIETAADQKERLTNRYQAYEFMKEVEDSGK